MDKKTIVIIVLIALSVILLAGVISCAISSGNGEGSGKAWFSWKTVASSSSDFGKIATVDQTGLTGDTNDAMAIELNQG